MRVPDKIILALGIALMIATTASAQRRTVPAKPGEVGVVTALNIANRPYHLESKGICQHAPVASIYSVMATMWSVEQSDGQQRIGLTLWRPRNVSGDMVMLSVVGAGKSFVVNTVKPSRNSVVHGSGKVTVTPSGSGAIFTIDATAADGAAIRGTIKCGALTLLTEGEGG